MNELLRGKNLIHVPAAAKPLGTGTLEAQLAAMTAERDQLKAQLADTQAGFEHAGYAPDWALMELVGNLRSRLERETLDRVTAQRSLVLICEMAAQLTDPTAYECIQDILHPEERAHDRG